MPGDPRDGSFRGLDPGLCAGCRHARTVLTGRGSTFWLCGRSDSDARFPKYPRLPVLQCIGYDPGLPGGADRE